jgi:hypothetical protein
MKPFHSMTTGSNKALNAPNWTSLERQIFEFQQPSINFASLFVWMADWEENRNKVHLSYLWHSRC